MSPARTLASMVEGEQNNRFRRGRPVSALARSLAAADATPFPTCRDAARHEAKVPKPVIPWSLGKPAAPPLTHSLVSRQGVAPFKPAAAMTKSAAHDPVAPSNSGRPTVMNLCRVAALAAALTSTVATIAHAQQAAEPKPFPERHPNPAQTIRMINFAGGFNLPIWMTQRQGFFAAEKIDVKMDFTPGSTYQLTHMIAGNYDMGFTAIDNIIAYREGQNEAYLPPGTNVDLIAVLASDDGFLSISAQKDVASVEALKGHTVTVDAMTTGFAFVLREVLARKGVAESDVKFERAGGVANRFRMMIE